jgi:hypothetical protein
MTRRKLAGPCDRNKPIKIIVLLWSIPKYGERESDYIFGLNFFSEMPNKPKKEKVGSLIYLYWNLSRIGLRENSVMKDTETRKASTVFACLLSNLFWCQFSRLTSILFFRLRQKLTVIVKQRGKRILKMQKMR